MELDKIGGGIEAAKEAIAWVSGLTGLSSIAVLAIGIAIGSKIIKGIIKVLLTIAIIAAGLYLWAQFG